MLTDACARGLCPGRGMPLGQRVGDIYAKEERLRKLVTATSLSLCRQSSNTTMTSLQRLSGISMFLPPSLLATAQGLSSGIHSSSPGTTAYTTLQPSLIDIHVAARTPKNTPEIVALCPSRIHAVVTPLVRDLCCSCPVPHHWSFLCPLPQGIPLVELLPFVSTAKLPFAKFATPSPVRMPFPDSSLPFCRICVITSTSLCVPNTLSSCWFDGLPSRPCAPWFDQSTWKADR